MVTTSIHKQIAARAAGRSAGRATLRPRWDVWRDSAAHTVNLTVWPRQTHALRVGSALCRAETLATSACSSARAASGVDVVAFGAADASLRVSSRADRPHRRCAATWFQEGSAWRRRTPGARTAGAATSCIEAQQTAKLPAKIILFEIAFSPPARRDVLPLYLFALSCMVIDPSNDWVPSRLEPSRAFFFHERAPGPWAPDLISQNTATKHCSRRASEQPAGAPCGPRKGGSSLWSCAGLLARAQPGFSGWIDRQN